MSNGDPGWGFSWRTALSLLIPQLGLRRQLKRAKAGEADALLTLRQLFMSFCFALVAFGVVLAVLYAGARAPADPPTALAGALLAVGAAASVLGRRMERPLNCQDDQRLVASYRTRFFVRMASSEVAALLGFVGFFLTYAWWTYPIGVAITAIGFRRAAPTAAHLAADQEQLNTYGCGRSLVQALRLPLPPRSDIA